AHNRATNGIQLELSPGDQIFLHGAAHTRRRVVKNRLDLRRVNLRAASVRHSTSLGDRRVQFLFPRGVATDLADVHTRCRSHQRSGCEEAKLAPEQTLLVRNELVIESKIAQASDDRPQKRLQAGGEVEAHNRRSLNESSRSSPLR